MTTKILFIDDENIVLHSCKRIFKNSGYNIDTASSGEEGLQKVNDNEYDIVVSDLKMPGIGGMEVLKTIRKEYPNLTVIIFTGYANVETARDALKNGAFDYIPKPFTPEEIRDVLENAIKSLEAREEVPMLDLMAIVSHELKSPVAVVHTTADTLYRGYFGKLGEGQKEIIETIIRNCEYLEDIIRSYIDLSKMELDELDSFMETLVLKEDVLDQSLAVPEVTNNRKEMKLNITYNANPSVHGDPKLLKIVFNNLINNAIKYCQENTPIDIENNI
jgi:two-component system sensor histidine kinase/response regulator